MKPNGPCIRTQDFIVCQVEPWRALAFSAQNHYSKSSPNTAVFAFGLYSAENRLTMLGCAIWIPPTKTAAQSVARDWMAVLSLSRFVVNNELPQNTESFFLGRCIRVIRKDRNWRVLLTYADEAEGHSGTIYKATNWSFRGHTSQEERWASGGRLISRKMGGRTLTKKQMLAAGYVSLGKSCKAKFTLVLREE